MVMTTSASDAASPGDVGRRPVLDELGHRLAIGHYDHLVTSIGEMQGHRTPHNSHVDAGDPAQLTNVSTLSCQPSIDEDAQVERGLLPFRATTPSLGLQ
jgi:hypothetical protein